MFQPSPSPRHPKSRRSSMNSEREAPSFPPCPSVQKIRIAGFPQKETERTEDVPAKSFSSPSKKQEIIDKPKARSSLLSSVSFCKKIRIEEFPQKETKRTKDVPDLPSRIQRYGIELSECGRRDSPAANILQAAHTRGDGRGHGGVRVDIGWRFGPCAAGIGGRNRCGRRNRIPARRW